MGGPDGVYLGITRWRFYIKCTHCSRPLTFLTDPKNADYEMESGGTRNYEYTHQKKAHDEKAEKDEEKEAKEDPLKALETRVLESQREMADEENLEAIRAMNARHVKLLSARKEGEEANFAADTEEVLRARHKTDQTAEVTLTEEDEELIKSVSFGRRPGPDGNGMTIRRLDEKDEERVEEARRLEASRMVKRQRELANKVQQTKTKAMPLVKVKRKRKVATEENASSNKKEKSDNTTSQAKDCAAGGLASLLGGYSSDSDSD